MQYVVDTRSSNLNVRSGPGTQYRVITSLHRNATVVVTGSQGDWKRIDSGGWVHGDYLRTGSASSRSKTATDPEESQNDGLVLPHYRWPNDPNRKMLAGFSTGQAALMPRHKRWLLDHAAPRARNGQWVFLRGYASKLGDPGLNYSLSVRRANAVRQFLTGFAGVRSNKITGSGGVGEQWSRGDDSNNDARWRAVEVIISNGIIQGDDIVIGADSPLSRRFYIKYLGGGGGGPGFQMQVHGFAIRNSTNWYVKYGFGGAGGTFGLSPLSLGNPLPAGRGWVPFTTSSLRTVDSFYGVASLRAAGAQIGSVGGSLFFKLRLNRWPGTIDIPTGSGLSLGYDVTLGYIDSDEDGPRHGNNWQYL